MTTKISLSCFFCFSVNYFSAHLIPFYSLVWKTSSILLLHNIQNYSIICLADFYYPTYNSTNAWFVFLHTTLIDLTLRIAQFPKWVHFIDQNLLWQNSMPFYKWKEFKAIKISNLEVDNTRVLLHYVWLILWTNSFDFPLNML